MIKNAHRHDPRALVPTGRMRDRPEHERPHDRGTLAAVARPVGEK
jgi:hypothetical protein